MRRTAARARFHIKIVKHCEGVGAAKKKSALLTVQLEVAKRSATAARREELGCRSYRRARWESRSTPDKRLLRQEVAERRGASAKRSLSPSIHASTHPSIHSFVHVLIH